MNDYLSGITLDLLSQGKEARVASAGSGTRSPIWYLPRNNPITVSFLQDGIGTTPTQWFPFREARAAGLLLPGTWTTGEYAGTPRGAVPRGMTAIVVEDIESITVDGEPKIRYKQPLIEVAPGRVLNVVNDIIDARSQRFPQKDGRTSVEWQVLTNVVVWDWPDEKGKDGNVRPKPDKGAHIVLQMPRRAAQMIREKMADFIDMDDEFDLTAWKWKMTLVSGTPNQLIMKKSEAEPLVEPLDVEPINLLDLVTERKERFEALVRAAYADMANPAAAPDFVEARDSSEEEKEVDEVVENEERDLFDMMTTAALRSRLKKAGVAIPAGASREKLLDLAIANQ